MLSVGRMVVEMVEVGTLVGAGRWPFAHAHPDCWNQPWSGTVLDVLDPQVWKGTIAFPGKRAPSREKVRAHVEWCRNQGLLGGDEIPVLWHFDGKTGPRVYWEKVEKVVPYAEDLASWAAARELARAQWDEPRKAA